MKTFTHIGRVAANLAHGHHDGYRIPSQHACDSKGNALCGVRVRAHSKHEFAEIIEDALTPVEETRISVNCKKCLKHIN